MSDPGDPRTFDDLHGVPANTGGDSEPTVETLMEQVEHMKLALATRTTIAQGIGVLMARGGHTADEAFAALRTASQRTNRKMVDLAAELISSHHDRVQAARPDRTPESPTPVGLPVRPWRVTLRIENAEDIDETGAVPESLRRMQPQLVRDEARLTVDLTVPAESPITAELIARDAIVRAFHRTPSIEGTS